MPVIAHRLAVEREGEAAVALDLLGQGEQCHKYARMRGRCLGGRGLGGAPAERVAD